MVRKFIIDTDERMTFPSQLINIVSGISEVSDFIKDRSRNGFFKDWGQHLVALHFTARELAIHIHNIYWSISPKYLTFN